MCVNQSVFVPICPSPFSVFIRTYKHTHTNIPAILLLLLFIPYPFVFLSPILTLNQFDGCSLWIPSTRNTSGKNWFHHSFFLFRPIDWERFLLLLFRCLFYQIQPAPFTDFWIKLVCGDLKALAYVCSMNIQRVMLSHFHTIFSL